MSSSEAMSGRGQSTLRGNEGIDRLERKLTEAHNSLNSVINTLATTVERLYLPHPEPVGINSKTVNPTHSSLEGSLEALLMRLLEAERLSTRILNGS